ncbi:hypothetical protein HDE69_005216 [Pedobacter cryoconitis]|uniref:SprT-like family protein n=1 Tax=Pedobacter cryoconitis TaxID=188932 RepID=A0A7W8YYE6_9SPHI|nr:hypothetical protein [Pedobacter cryoconitis]MBB5624119.1 hypothetical protein [Pedobacter cryoconitis]
MKKLYALKKLSLLVSLILFLHSCKKEIPLSVDKQSKFPTVTVDEGRNWVKNNKPTLSIGNENWKKANIVESANNEKGNNLLRVPINETLLEDKTWIIRDLIFQKDSLGQVVCDVYKIIPNADYISKKAGKNRSATFKREFIDNNDFTGQILLFTIDNQLIRGRKYVNGKLEFELEKKRRRNYGALMSGNPTSTELGAPETCNDPNDGCRNEKGGGGDYSWVNQLEEVNITAPAKTTPNYTPPSYFGGNIPPGDIYNVSKPGGGGGGSDGSNPVTIEKRDTSSYVKNPCIGTALSLALNKNVKNEVKLLMTNTFLAGHEFNLSFYDFPFNNTKNTEAYTGFSSLSNRHNITISFNTNTMPNHSQEYNVATVYHEILHAYFDILYGVPEPGNPMLVPDHHEYIADNYVNMLTKDLMSIFPNLSESDARNLSWGGLQNTNIYKRLLPATQNEIIRINTLYSTKSTNPAISKGTYCP